jgi:hypothetical protein
VNVPSDAGDPVSVDAEDGPRPDPVPAGPLPTDENGPVSEADALRLLTGDGPEAAENATADKVAAIADLLAERLRGGLKDPGRTSRTGVDGLSIGTVALFQDTVSFGGDLNTGAGPRRAAGLSGLVALDESELADYVEHFVHPPGYGAAFEVLREHRLVVLAAAPGSGREATAVNLLAEATALLGAAEPGGLHRVVAADLADDWQPPLKGAGFLLAADTGRESEIDHSWLVRTSTRLRASGGFMVVTSGPPRGALARAAELGEHVCTRLGGVDLFAVLQRRALGGTADEADVARLRSRLAACGGLEALREQPFVRTAVRLARVAHDRGDLAAEVARVRDPSEQVRQWFARNREPAALSFALAAAVLDGCGYLTVSDGALRLLAQLSSPEQPPKDLRFHERLTGEQHWLEVVAEPGRAALVRFRSPLVPAALLGHAWVRLDGMRTGVLSWLRGLLNHPDLEVRARAAVAAGVIAWQDPGHAVHGYLRSWSGSESLAIRRAAATSLAVTAGTPVVTGTAEQVWTLVEEWSVSRASAFERRLARTAVMAVGGTLGRTSPARALALLRAALEWPGDWANIATVARSTLDLVRAGLGRDVLTAQLEWSKAQDLSEPVTKALSVFLYLAHHANDDDVPLLLAETVSGTLPMSALEELWARALARKPVQDQAVEVLREWVEAADAERRPKAFASLRTLLLRIAGRPGKHRERLIYHLGLWERRPDLAMPSAAALRQAIERSS